MLLGSWSGLGKDLHELPHVPESPRRHQPGLHLLTDVIGSSPHPTQVGQEYKCSRSWLGEKKGQR